MSARIGIIGAGISGLVCAARLHAAGHRVHVIEKSGDIGGRLATRRRAEGRWNHGAARLDPRRKAFKDFLDARCADGSARRVEAFYEGVPDMRELLRPLTAGLSIDFRARVVRLARTHGAWSVETDSGARLEPFDLLICTQPAPQIVALLRHSVRTVPASLEAVGFEPCWVGLLGFAEKQDAQPAPPAGRQSMITHIERRSAPEQALVETWVVHTSASWTRANLELDPDRVAAAIGAELDRRSVSPLQPDQISAHRWRYARSTTPLGMSHLWLPDEGLGFAGDWCLGRNAEDAFTSAVALTNALPTRLMTNRSTVPHRA